MTSITLYLQDNLAKIAPENPKDHNLHNSINTSSLTKFGSSVLHKAKQATTELSNSANNCLVHVSPGISEKILNNAIPSFSNDGKYTIKQKNIIGIVDTTIIKNAKDGLLFVATGFYYKKAFSDSVFIKFEDIQDVSIGSKKDENTVVLALKNGGKIPLSLVADCNASMLKGIITTCVSDFDEYQEENVLVALTDMAEEIRIAYTKIVINMAYYDDQKVDEKELAEILKLMTRLEFSPASRLEIRSYLSMQEDIVSVENLVATLEHLCTPTEFKALMVSLCKDLMYLNSSVAEDQKVTSDFSFYNDHKKLFNVSDQTIELIRDAISIDKKLLSEETTNEQVAAEMKKLVAKGAAVGTPIAAIYLSGSVIGLSASGMTSGLAALGMGGILGLSSMATGIGVVVLLGVGTYAGVKKISGADEKASIKRRETMLIKVSKQMQITVSQLMEDIAYITEKLNGLISSQEQSKELTAKLVNTLKQLTSAGKVLNQSIENNEKAQLKTHIPKELDKDKLLNLTPDVTEEMLQQFVLGCYEKNEEDKYLLRSGLSIKDLGNLSIAFENIGYFKLSDIVAGAASHQISKAKDVIKGAFH